MWPIDDSIIGDLVKKEVNKAVFLEGAPASSCGMLCRAHAKVALEYTSV